VPDILGTPGIRSVVDVPIVVEGRVWGALGVAARRGPLPDIERRLTDFTELVATAIANAQAHSELTASRARIVTTADQTRRRIERDLHDGAQQELVSLALQLQTVRASVPPELDELATDLDRVAARLSDALDHLREIARGIHPAILAEGGLAPALKALARRSPVPVDLMIHAERQLPEPVEVGAYYVVSEALTNVAKHGRASAIKVAVESTQRGLARAGS
jgi:signal transduction histidine kinase